MQPTSLLNLPEDDESDLAVDQDVAELGGVADVSLRLEATPTDLSEGSFFQTLIGAALDRMPVAVYPEVRSRRRAALTGSP